jgi:GntR family transcriptional regulator, transcriptional repressor for pyruvate dehydrogenase complex
MGAEKRKDDVTTKLLGTFKQLIFRRSLASGNRLPGAREIASTGNVSRGSLRQTLTMLEVLGVISRRVGDGTYLNDAAAAFRFEGLIDARYCR